MGVALAVGIDVATASVRRSFQLSAQAITGRTTHQVLPGPSGVDEATYRQLWRAPDRPPELLFAPVLTGDVVPSEGGGTLQLLGIDPLAEAPFRPDALLAAPGAASFAQLLSHPGAAVLSAETARRLRVARDGHLIIGVGGRSAALTVLDIVAPVDQAQRRALDGVAIVDLATAQEALGQLGRLSRIDVIVAGPAGAPSTAAALTWLGAHLTPDLRLESAAGRTGALEQMIRAFDLNLQALSMMALLVGAFLIYNTMTFSVVQRRSLLAILRTLGVTRGELARNLLIEAVVIGAAGSVAGVLIGLGLSRGLVRLVARGVSDLYFAVSVADVPTPLAPLGRGLLLGIAAAVVSAIPAARDATFTEPNVALRRSAVERRAHGHVARLALAGLGLVAASLGLLALSGRGLAVGLGALLALLVGCAAVTPILVLWAARLSSAVVAALRNATGLLAARSIAAGLSRTGTATAALALALAVTTGVGVMVTSFRGAVERWLAVTLTADVYISAPSGISVRADSPLPPTLLDRLRRLDGVDAIATNRWITIPVDGAPTLVMAEEPAPGRPLNVELLQGDRASAWPAFVRGDAVLVSEPLAYKRRLATGAIVTLATDEGPRPFEVAAIYRDYGSDAGALMLHRQAYDRLFRDRARSGIALYAARGVTADALIARVRAVLGPDENVTVRSTRALRETSLAIFDRTFEITSVLRLFALVVAAFGVAGALMALSLERARELATLRALGATPGQVAKLTLIETGLLGGLAGVVAMPLGTALSAFLVFVINRRSFGWTMPLTFDVRSLLAAPALGVLAGLAGGLYPAWRAARVDPARALREE